MTKIFLHNHLYEPEGDGILLVDPGLARRSSPRDVLHTLPLVQGEVGVQVRDGGGVLALGTCESLHQQVRQTVQLWQGELDGGGGLRRSLPAIVGFHDAFKWIKGNLIEY